MEPDHRPREGVLRQHLDSRERRRGARATLLLRCARTTLPRPALGPARWSPRLPDEAALPVRAAPPHRPVRTFPFVDFSSISACRTQYRSAASVRSSSWATWPTVFPRSRTSLTVSALNSGVNFRRGSPRHGGHSRLFGGVHQTEGSSVFPQGAVGAAPGAYQKERGALRRPSRTS